MPTGEQIRTPPGYSVVQNIGMGMSIATTLWAGGTEPVRVLVDNGGRPTERDDAEQIARSFRTLSEQWKAERKEIGPTSDLTRLFGLPSFLSIIALGSDAVPFIVAELDARPDHWWCALEVLTRENPVPPESRGRSRAVRDAWLAWGRSRGYLA